MAPALRNGMQVQTNNYIDVAARSRELGHRVPVGIALLPGNYSTAADAGEFCFHEVTPHVRSAWQSAGLEDEGPSGTGVGDLGSGVSSGIRTLAPNPQSLDLSASAKVPLAVFFGVDVLAGPPWRLTVALGMISSVFASHSRRTGQRDVRLDLVVERIGERGCACIEYQGDAFGIVALA
jgi:hypothetical protein